MVGGSNLDGINLAAPEPKNPEPTPSIKDRVLLEWEGLSFQKNEKTKKWYLFATLIVVATVGYSAWQRDWFVIAVTLILTLVILWYNGKVHPEKQNYQVTPLGIFVGEKIYPFSEIHSFWIVYNDAVKKIYFAFTRNYLPSLTINIENVDPVSLRSVLLKRIPEQAKRGEALIDRFSRLIGL